MEKIYYCDQFPQEISQHCLAYSLLERALQLEYPEISWENVKYGRDELGKPFLTEHPGIQFNISHCKTCVACVIGSDRVGIDVERRFPWKDPLARRICHPKETEWLLREEEAGSKAEENGNRGQERAEKPCADSRTARLNLLWSRKESYLKCIGTGIRSDLREINVLEELKDDNGSFCFQQLQKPEFTLVACGREKDTVPIIRIKWQDLWK